MNYRSLRIFMALLLFPAAAFAGEYSINGTTDKKKAIYKPGEKIVFILKVLDGEKPVSGKTIKWRRTGDDGKVENGSEIAPAEGLKITTTLDKPGFVRIYANAYNADGSKTQGYVGGFGKNKTGHIFFDGGACVEPGKLPTVGEPKDFDSFWKETRAKLDKVPIDPQLTKLKSNGPEFELYAVKLSCAGPSPVTGYLTIPVNATERSLPAAVSFHGYGANKHNRPRNYRKGFIAFDVNAHGMELEKDDAYYAKFSKDMVGYGLDEKENSNRETTYFYGMVLRVMRALDYIKTRKEWNGKDLTCTGGSQGGAQSLWGAALDKDVTICNVWSPWLCDFGGKSLGRLKGWLPKYQDALLYYDPIFHAKRIKARTKIVANFGDYTCAPSGVWIVYNNIPHNDKTLEVRQGCTHSYNMKNFGTFFLTPDKTADNENNPHPVK